MRFSLLSVFPFELNKGIIYLYYFLTLLFVLFTGPLNAQTDGCPWAGEDQNICSEGSVLLGCSNIDEYCYKWEPEEGLNDPRIAQPTATPDETTTYTLYVIDDGNIIGTDEVTVTIEEDPEILIIPENPSICNSGESITLEADIWGDNNNFSFRWSTGVSTASISVDMPDTYTLTVTNNLTNCSTITEVEVETALHDLIILSDTDQICEGQSIELESSLQGDEYTFEWTTGETTPTISVEEAGIYSLTVSLSNTDCRYIAEHTLNESEKELVFEPLTPIVCDGKSLELSVEESYETYEWSNAGWDGNTRNTPAITINSEDVAVSPIFNLTVTDLSGCTLSGSIEVQNASNPAAILAWLEQKGFYSIDIEIADDPGFNSTVGDRSLNSPCDPLCEDPDALGSCVKDDAELLFSIDGENIESLYEEVKTNLDYFEAQFGYERSRAYISKNENWCACTEGEYVEQIERYFAGANMAYWIHLYKAEDGGQDKLFILGNMPSSEAYYPNAGNRASVLDVALTLDEQDLGDGNTGAESLQKLFSLMDLLLDNFLDASPFGDGLPSETEASNDLPICSNADMGGKVGLSPAGIPILLPDLATARFIPHESYSVSSPDGALIGFTDLSLAAENDGLLLYYSARVNVTGLPVSIPTFQGYFRNNYRGGQIDGSYLSFTPPVPTTVTLGMIEPALPETPESVQLFDKRFKWNQFNNYIPFSMLSYDDPGETGAGEMIQGTFPDNWFNDLAGPPLIIDIELEEITEINFSDTQIHIVYDQEGIIYQIQLADGETAYLLAVLIDGELIISQWNCHTGEYQEIPDPQIPDEILVQMEADLTSLQNDRTTEGAENEILGEKFCYDLTPAQAGNFPEIDPLNENLPSSDNVRNFAVTDISDFQEAADRAAMRYGCKVNYIVTADARAPIPDSNTPTLPANYQGARHEFDNMPLNSESPDKADAVFWIHIRNNGSVGFCIRLADDLFKYTKRTNFTAEQRERLDDNGQLPDGVALELENMLVERIRTSLFYMEDPDEITTDVGSCEPIDHCGEAPDESCGLGGGGTFAHESPWAFGKRANSTEDVNFLTVSKEIVGLGKGFMEELEIPEKLCRGNEDGNVTLFEIPEVVLGSTNIVVGENPIVGAVQLGTMAWSFVEDKQTREAIIDMGRHPRRTAQAFYEEKKETYEGCFGQERLLLSSGEDGATIVMAIWSGGGTLLAKVGSLGKKAKDSARKLSDGIGDHPGRHADDVDFNNLPDDPFYRQFEDFSPEEIVDYHNYMGKFSTATRKKMTDNPWLARMWKEFKDDVDFCPFNFQGGGSLDQRDPCITFDDFLKRCPDSPDAFYDKFKEVFLVSGTDRIIDPEKVEDFLRDIDGDNSIFDEFKARPELLHSWNSLYSDEFLRVNPDKLAKVDNYANDFDRSFDDIADEFANVPASQRSGWIDHLEFRTNGIRVNKAGNNSNNVFNSFQNNSDVPSRYTDNSRFNDLATDHQPGGGTVQDGPSRREAMAGLEAESQGLIDGPIQREQSPDFEFIDSNGDYWDVKGPPSIGMQTPSQIAAAGQAIKSQFLAPSLKGIILDCSWMNTNQLNDLREWLVENVDESNLDRIIEINSNLF